MSTGTSTPSTTGHDGDAPPGAVVRTLIGRITRLEVAVAAVIAAVMVVLLILEPDIAEAPFENGRTLLFTFGGTAMAALAFVAMLWLRVPPVIRLVVLVVPFAIVNWWLISPYFIDDVVDETFSTSIAEQAGTADEAPDAAAPTIAPAGAEEPAATGGPGAQDQPEPEDPPADDAPVEGDDPPASPGGPVLLGAGQFVGLAGHSGSGDAGIFQNPDGSVVLRFENFEIQNGPDLEVYLVPGADQVSLAAGSIHLGALKGNVGDQNYDLPAGTELAPGEYTVLVWCEAFSVEFVGATVVV